MAACVSSRSDTSRLRRVDTDQTPPRSERRMLALPKGVTVAYGYAHAARLRSAHPGYRR